MESKKPNNLAGDKRLERLKQKAAQAEAAALKKNIYKRGVFEQLAEVGSEILEIANSTKKKYQDVLAEAGIKDPYDVLIQSMNHWDKMLHSSELPSEEQLIQQLREDFQINLIRAAKVFVPTDELQPKHGDSEESKEKGDDVNRVSLALETLLHVKLGDEQLLLDDIEVVVGRTPEHGWRTRPYWIINLKNYKIAIFVNNQHANRTFVVGYKTRNELEKLEGYTKEQLKELSEKNKMVHHFIYHDADQFKSEFAAAIQRVFEGKEMLKPYATYEEASAVAKRLGIKTEPEYVKLKRYKEDPRLPATPKKKYADNFIGWGDFLGTGNVSTVEKSRLIYQTYKKARMAVRKLGIKSVAQYHKRYKENPRLPGSPERKYKDSWKGWADFLGTKILSNIERGKKVYQTYKKARVAVRKLGIKSGAQYHKRYKEDPRLPAAPEEKYGDSFISRGDFFGTNIISTVERGKQVYQTYKKARMAVRRLGIKSVAQYHKRYKKDPRLPGSPDRKYKDSWKGWSDFLGTENVSAIERSKQFYTTYKEASAAAKKLKIKSYKDYHERYKEDPRLPATPNITYGDRWKGWRHFLGKKKK